LLARYITHQISCHSWGIHDSLHPEMQKTFLRTSAVSDNFWPAHQSFTCLWVLAASVVQSISGDLTSVAKNQGGKGLKATTNKRHMQKQTRSKLHTNEISRQIEIYDLNWINMSYVQKNIKNCQKLSKTSWWATHLLMHTAHMTDLPHMQLIVSKAGAVRTGRADQATASFSCVACGLQQDETDLATP